MSFQAQTKPLAMFLMVDQSSSMTDRQDRWNPVSTALQTFINDPASAGIKVAMSYFPVESLEETVKCSAASYSTPAVPMGLLPDAAPALTSSLSNKMFTVGMTPMERQSTPTRPAFEGTASYVSSWLQANPDHVGVIVLATDGEPSTCGQNAVSDVVRQISAAATGTPAIRTFVIGIGTINNLNQFATAGGTGRRPFVVDGTGTNTQAEFLEAMQEIRGAALPCQFQIPASSSGAQDLNKVNVDLELAGGASKEPLVKVQNAEACTATGWHYDNPNTPSTIVLCPDACTRLTGDQSAKVSIALGCDTRIF